MPSVARVSVVVASYNVENFFDQTDEERNQGYGDYRILPNAQGQSSNFVTPVEFEGQTMREVAIALTQDPMADLGSAWDHPFAPEAFVALLQDDTAGVRRLTAITDRLNGAFRRHVEAVSQGRQRIVLVDTGLYGSTLRLLRAGMPDRQWLAAQFARSNYKGFATPHFDGTVGVSVERDGYVAYTEVMYEHLRHYDGYPREFVDIVMDTGPGEFVRP